MSISQLTSSSVNGINECKTLAAASSAGSILYEYHVPGELFPLHCLRLCHHALTIAVSLLQTAQDGETRGQLQGQQLLLWWLVGKLWLLHHASMVAPLLTSKPISGRGRG